MILHYKKIFVGFFLLSNPPTAKTEIFYFFKICFNVNKNKLAISYEFIVSGGGAMTR